MNSTINIRANQVRPGDLLAYGGRMHRITDIVRRAGASWPIDVYGTGWAIALGDGPIKVRRG